MEEFFKKWQVVAAAFIAAGLVVGQQMVNQFDSNPDTVPEWGLVGAAIAAFLASFGVRPNKVSSEEAGAKK